MNKDFVITSENEAYVSNSDGRIVIMDCDSLEEKLLSENKQELIDNKLDKANKKLESDIKVKKLSKFMLIVQPIFFICWSCIGFIYGGLTNLSNFLPSALYHLSSAIVTGGLVASLSAIYWAVLNIVFKKKIKKDKTKINAIEIIKKNYEKDNRKIKSNEYNKSKISTKQIVSLDNNTELINRHLDSQIKMIYDSNLKYTPTLSLKRK